VRIGKRLQSIRLSLEGGKWQYPDLHQKLKMKCVMECTTIADMIRGWIEEECE
jgi:hypothetical protein